MKHWKVHTKIMLLIVVLMGVISNTHLYMTSQTARDTVIAALQKQGERMAKEIVKLVDAETHKRIAKKPRVTDEFWELCFKLDEIKKSIGAMYLDTIAKHTNGKYVYILDAGTKEEVNAYPLFEEVPPDVISTALLDRVMKGEIVQTDIIDDPEYGLYFATLVPIKDKSGKPVAIFELDLSAADVEGVYDSIWSANLPVAVAVDVILLGLLLYATYYVIRRTLKPLSVIQDLVAIMSVGDLRADRRLHAYTGLQNEIGAIAGSFRVMTEKLGKLIRNVQTSNNLLQKEFDQIYHYSETIHEQAQAVSIASDEITRGNIQTASSLDIMTASSEMIVNQIDEANQAVDKMCRIVHETTEKFHEVSHSMNKLSTQSQQIESIVEMIRDITDQINLLSLNASIEAARAGEYGRGFAVVADEVRKLAAQSADATKMIRNSLNEVRSHISFAKDKTEVTMRQFFDQSSSLDQVMLNTQQMHDLVNKIHNEIISVSASSGETAASTQETTATLHEMENNIQHYLRRLQDVAEVVREVKQMSDVFQLNGE